MNCLHQYENGRCVGCGDYKTAAHQLLHQVIAHNTPDKVLVDVNIRISLPKAVWEALGPEQRHTGPRIRAMFTEQALRAVLVKVGAAIPAKFSIEVNNAITDDCGGG